MRLRHISHFSNTVFSTLNFSLQEPNQYSAQCTICKYKLFRKFKNRHVCNNWVPIRDSFFLHIDAGLLKEKGTEEGGCVTKACYYLGL